MHVINYDSVKFTNYVQRFCIRSRVSKGVAEFTLLVHLANNERDEVLSRTFFKKIFWRTIRLNPKKKTRRSESKPNL